MSRWSTHDTTAPNAQIHALFPRLVSIRYGTTLRFPRLIWQVLWSGQPT